LKSYAGIGSRETPSDVLGLIIEIAIKLDSQGYVLNSGGASGADTAFEQGSSNKQIFLPSDTFNGRHHNGVNYFNYQKLPHKDLAEETVSLYHPAPHKLSEYAFRLMARNTFQVLGKDLQTSVEFTYKLLNKILEKIPEGNYDYEFIYRASW
jgi:hypothetical protein